MAFSLFSNYVIVNLLGLNNENHEERNTFLKVNDGFIFQNLVMQHNSHYILPLFNP